MAMTLRRLQQTCFPEEQRKLKMKHVFEKIIDDPFNYFVSIDSEKALYLAHLVRRSGIESLSAKYGTGEVFALTVHNMVALQPLLCDECDCCTSQIRMALKNICNSLDQVLGMDGDKSWAWVNIRYMMLHCNVFPALATLFKNEQDKDKVIEQCMWLMPLATRLVTSTLKLMPQTVSHEMSTSLVDVLEQTMLNMSLHSVATLAAPAVLLGMIKMPGAFRDGLRYFDMMLHAMPQLPPGSSLQTEMVRVFGLLTATIDLENADTLQGALIVQATQRALFSEPILDVDLLVERCLRKQQDTQRLQAASEATLMPECVVCRSRPRNVVGVACGHFAVCAKCAGRCGDKCPMCRKQTSFLNVVLS
jgi:hypothetical protein